MLYICRHTLASLLPAFISDISVCTGAQPAPQQLLRVLHKCHLWETNTEKHAQLHRHADGALARASIALSRKQQQSFFPMLDCAIPRNLLWWRQARTRRLRAQRMVDHQRKRQAEPRLLRP